MLDKRILRKKKDGELGKSPIDSDEEEWSKITASVGEKLEDTDMMDVTARTITFNQDEAGGSKEESYHDSSEEFKDGFGNTAQYVKFINAHLKEKKSRLDKLKTDNENFEKQLASLKPGTEKSKTDLDLINYKDIKSEDVKQILSMLEKEKQTAEAKVVHFKEQLERANTELTNKAHQIKETESELANIKNKEEAEQVRIEKEGDAVEMLKSQLSSVNNETNNEKIFGAINSLVVLLNSKNQDTVNELNSIKSEFNQMKQDYEEALKKLKEKS